MKTVTRILLLADVNSPHTRRWLHAIASQPQIEVAVFSLTRAVAPGINGVKIFSATLDASYARKSNAIAKALNYMKMLPQLQRVYKEYKPDVVHAMYASSYGLLGALLRPKVFFVSAWGSDVFEFPKKNFISRFVLRFVFSRAHRLYSTSHYMATEMQRYTAKSIHVIPYGVDTTIFAPNTKDQDAVGTNEFVIGTIKSHERTYGIDVLVRAFALLCRKRDNLGLKLLLVGSGSQSNALKQLSAELGIADQVQFVGNVPHADVAMYHRSMDVFVAPTLQESFGVSLLEAMSTAVPCVVSDIPPYREINGDANAVVFFEKGSVHDLYEKLNNLIGDSIERKRLGGAARQRVKSTYDARSIEATIVQQYHIT